MKGVIALLLVSILVVIVLVIGARGRDAPRDGEPMPSPEQPAVASAGGRITGAILAGPDDLFEESALAMGIDFVHHLGDDRMDNILESVGSGGATIDYDGDGDLDLYLVDQGHRVGVSDRGSTPARHGNRLFRNLGDGRFEDATAEAGVEDMHFGFGAVAADVNGDGWIDLYVLNAGPNVLYRNRGDGTFEDVTAESGVGGDANTVAATFLDADADGDFDLYVGNYLAYDANYQLHYAPDGFPGPLAYAAQADVFYENAGDGTFRDATSGSGIDSVAPSRAMGVVAFDADLDGHVDVYVANDATANFFFRGLGGGRFEEIGVQNGTAYGFQGDDTAAMAGNVGDYDGDGLPDIFVTDTAYGALYRNLGEGQFSDRVRASGVAAPSAQWANWGGGFLDFDADGDLDLFAASSDLHHPTGRPDLLLENQGDGTFLDAGPRGGRVIAAECLGRGGLIADLDDDGHLDIVMTNIGDRTLVLRNRGVAGHHTVTVDLSAERRPRICGRTRIRLEAGGRTQVREVHLRTGYLTQGDARVHFGLGVARRVDRLEIVYPDGRIQVFEDIAADQIFRPPFGEEGVR